MASSAFKSTTKRSPIGAATKVDDASSPNQSATQRRRSRSLSRFSGLWNALELDELPPATPRSRFVNKVRGSSFVEITSLDDLASDFFPLNLKDKYLDADVLRESECGRSRSSSARCISAIGDTCSSETISGTKGAPHSQEQRLRRSVSRQANASPSAGTAPPDNRSNSTRRRSLSVGKCRFSDSECDIDHSCTSSSKANPKNFITGNYQRSPHQQTDPNHQSQKGSLSQKDFLELYDGYSIDHPTRDGEGTALYEAMRKELRHAVKEIRTELEQAMVKTKSTVLVDGDLQANNSELLQAVAIIRKNYMSKLEESAKRKQELLSQVVVEEQRHLELSKIVRELLPGPEKAVVAEKPLPSKKGSNERRMMSKCLTEEVVKYFENFMSNVEDTDISSYDGERSDASSTLGGTRPRDFVIQETGTLGISARSSFPDEMDGVVLPWLRWDISNYDSPLLCKNREEATAIQNNTQDAVLDVNRGCRVPESYLGHSAIYGPCGSSWFDREEFPHCSDNEDLLFECWRQRQKINSVESKVVLPVECQSLPLSGDQDAPNPQCCRQHSEC